MEPLTSPRYIEILYLYKGVRPLNKYWTLFPYPGSTNLVPLTNRCLLDKLWINHHPRGEITTIRSQFDLCFLPWWHLCSEMIPYLITERSDWNKLGKKLNDTNWYSFTYTEWIIFILIPHPYETNNIKDKLRYIKEKYVGSWWYIS